MSIETKCYKILGKKEVECSTLVEVPKDWNIQQVKEYIWGSKIDTWTEEDTGFDPIEISDEDPELIDDKKADEMSYEIGMFFYDMEEDNE
tara:strand:+ start:455 stop:724 length:270 start_codon:yes stop_codon:yes gene_type:complete